MDHEVEVAELTVGFREHGVDGGGIGDVAVADDFRIQLFGDGHDALFQRVALIGEGEVRPGGGACLGDAVGKRAVVRDAENQPALAAHQPARFSHELPPATQRPDLACPDNG